MYKIRQFEVEEISNILTTAALVPVPLVRALLSARGKKPAQIETILNQMVKNKMAWYDDDKLYLRANKSVTPNDLNRGCIKALWLLIDLMKHVRSYFLYISNAFHVLSFQKETDEEADPFYEVFYVPDRDEHRFSYAMSQFESDNKQLSTKCFILLENAEQFRKIQIPDSFEVVAFVTVSYDGVVQYLYPNEHWTELILDSAVDVPADANVSEQEV